MRNLFGTPREPASLRNTLSLTLAIAVLCIATGNLNPAHAQTTSLVSLNKLATDSGNLGSGFRTGFGFDSSSISADGRFVVFYSNATDLVDDPVGLLQVYVRDLKIGKTTLVSRNRFGTGSGNQDSYSPVISGNGRFVAFFSYATDLVPDQDNNNNGDVFVRDLQLGTTRLVSISRDGIHSAEQFSFRPIISADGATIVFQSYAGDLVDNDNNQALDLFARDLQTGTTTCVSVDRNGVPTGNQTALSLDSQPVVSGDGRYVAFSSSSNNLVDNDTVCDGNCNGTNGLEDVFVRDLFHRETVLVSINRTGANGGNARSHSPSISADGRRVAFRSFATDLGNNDTTPQPDIYVRDLAAGSTELVSVNMSGTNGGGNGAVGMTQNLPLISGNGRFVAFRSAAIDLTPNKQDAATFDVFVRDLEHSQTTLASVNLNGNDTGHGSGAASNPIAFSMDGRFLLFNSNARDLVANDSDNSSDLFVRDLAKGKTSPITVNRQGTPGHGCDNCGAAISADGRRVAFESVVPDLVAVDNNNTGDVFWRPVFAGNALDDAQFFVTQHYRDFLNREPDSAGLAFWMDQITACGSDVRCTEEKRINVSTAFFLSIEFQNTGYLLHRLQATSFSGSLPRLQPFIADLRKLRTGLTVGAPGWEQLLEANKQSFTADWVQRPEFLALYPADMRSFDYVNALFSSANVTPSEGELAAALAAFGNGGIAGRAGALRSVVDSRVVYNHFYNSAFVLMQYFGYLQRNPDDPPDTDLSGYQFWLSKMDLFSFPTDDVRDQNVALNRVRRAEMVKAFLVSGEYRARFGP